MAGTGNMRREKSGSNRSSATDFDVELMSQLSCNCGMGKTKPKSRRGSTDAIVQCRFKRPRSIIHECEPPLPHAPGDGRGGDCSKDFQTQVEATDILPAEAVQTGASLTCRKPDLPKRNPERLRNKAGRKCWNTCDCEGPRLRSRLDCLVDKRDVNLQADPRDIGSTESVQTGPSLIASGSFCRFDYKMRKPKYLSEDCYAGCEKSKEQVKSKPCNINRDCCTDFNQQVTAVDIKITDESQTGDSIRHEPRDMFDCKRGEKIMCARLPCPPYSYRRLYKSPHLHDCDCPCAQFLDYPKTMRNFASQVKATNICPSRGAQTSPSLTGVCIKPRRYSNRSWETCTRPSQQVSKFQEAPYVKHVCLQVCPLDITSCEAVQTGSSLALNDVGPKFACAKPATKRRFVRYPILYGRGKNFKNDDCACPCPRAGGRDSQTCDATSQVVVTDINPSNISQTCPTTPLQCNCKDRKR